MTDQTQPRRSPAEQARLETLLRDIFEHRLCFNELLGLRVESLDPAAPKIGFSMRKNLIGNAVLGRLHGGVIAAVLDTVAGLAVTVAIAEKFNSEDTEHISQRFHRIGTIDLRTDFLHQGVGKQFVATGKITRLGGRIASVQMSLENESGVLISTGSAAYVVS